MKKLFIASALLVSSLVSFADTDISTYDNVVYIESTSAQIGGTATLDVYAKTTSDQGGFQFNVVLPEGVTYVSDATPLGGGWVISENVDTDPLQFMAYDGADATPVKGTAKIATITVNLASTVAPGALEVKVVKSIFGENTITDEIVSTLTAQRAAVIGKMGDKNRIEITPFTMPKGQTYAEGSENNFVMTILGQSEANVKSLEFTLTLPEGIAPATDPDDDEAYIDPGIEASKKGSATPSIEKNDDGTYSFSYSGSSSKYIYALSELSDMFTINLTSSSTLADNVYTAKLTKITMTTTAGDEYTGDYYFSVMIGTTQQTDPIAYGNYTQEALTELVEATSTEEGAKNIRTLDLSQATITNESGTAMTEEEISQKFNDIMVCGKEKTCYTREVKSTQNWGTICVPYALTSGNGVHYYEVTSATTEAVTLTPVDNLAADVPAFFRVDEAGTNITASAEGYKFPTNAGSGEKVENLQMVGTYESTNVAKGDYYLSNNMLYSDGATIRPFKAYLKSTGSNARAYLDILLDDETGIHQVATMDTKTGEIYDLAGRKQNKVQRGVNIVDGKKILKK